MFHPPLTPFSYPCRAQAGSARAAAGAKPFRTSLHSFLALPRMRAQRQAAAGRATIDSTPLPSTGLRPESTMNVEPATACAFVHSAGRACARRVGCAHARSVRAACKACEACEGCACNSCAFESCEAFTRKACEVPFMKRSHQACVCKARVCKCMSAAHARACACRGCHGFALVPCVQGRCARLAGRYLPRLARQYCTECNA
eukprot:3364110-Pleurochrysis_carterae.AAC.1